MLSKIEALREKPKHVRNRYAFWIAFFVTFVILALWATTLPARLSSAPEETPADDSGSLDAFAEAFGSVISRASETFKSLQASSTTEIVDSEAQSGPQQLDFEALIASSSLEHASATVSIETNSTSSAAAASSTATTARQSE